MDRKIELIGIGYELVFPRPHGLSAPTGHGVLVDGFAFVGNHQVLVDADDLAVTFARRAGAQRVVEAEQMFGRRLEFDAVGLETGRELFDAFGRDDSANPVSIGESTGYGIPQAGRQVAVLRNFGTIDYDRDIFGTGVFVHAGQEILDRQSLSRRMYTQDAFAQHQGQFFDDALPFAQLQRRCDGHAAAFGQGEDILRHVVFGVALDLLSRYGREGVSDAGVEQFKVVVQFGRGADRRTRIAGIDLLFDGDGRSDTRNDIHIGLVDLAQELSGIGREALHVAALPFGEDRVEGEGRFAGTRKSRDDDQSVVRNFDLDVFEVVHPCTFYINGLLFFCHVFLRGSGPCAVRVPGRTDIISLRGSRPRSFPVCRSYLLRDFAGSPVSSGRGCRTAASAPGAVLP